MYGHWRIVQVLLENGADVNVNEPLFIACMNINNDIDDLKIVKMLLEAGVDVDSLDEREEVLYYFGFNLITLLIAN
jgi:ankyrin repeat protein